jgi:hypothetical protein
LTPNLRLSILSASKVNSEPPVLTLAVTFMTALRLPAAVWSKYVRTACRKGLGQRPFTPSVVSCSEMTALPSSYSELRNLGRLVAVMWSKRKRAAPSTQLSFHCKLVLCWYCRKQFGLRTSSCEIGIRFRKAVSITFVCIIHLDWISIFILRKGIYTTAVYKVIK